MRLPIETCALAETEKKAMYAILTRRNASIPKADRSSKKYHFNTPLPTPLNKDSIIIRSNGKVHVSIKGTLTYPITKEPDASQYSAN